MSSANRVAIRPTPSDAEAAAIAVALNQVFHSGAAAQEPPVPNPTWRFSGRWWSQRRYGGRTTR